MRKSNILTQKLAALWADDRKYRFRLFFSCAPIFAACFLFVFFGPFEVVAYSGGSLSYSHTDIAFLLLGAAFVCCLVLAPLLSLLKGKIYDIIITIISSVSLAGYVQSLFFNSSLTSLTGDAVNWSGHAFVMFIDLLVWLLIITLGFFLLYLGRNIWKSAVLFLSFAIFVLTVTSSVSVFFIENESSGKYATLTTEGMYRYSAGSNTFVFVLDRLDYKFIEEVMEEDPAFFEKLDGFTQYTNAVSTFSRTRPAINHIFTGSHEYAYRSSIEEFREKTWTDGGKNILGDIKKQGYDIDIYAQIQDLYIDSDFASENISNIETDKFGVDPLPMLLKMAKLSMYRHAPTALKPFFETDTNYYNIGVLKSDTSYTFNDSAYAPGFKTSTAERTNNNFKFYHFNGSHAPYFMNADGTASAIPTSSKKQTMGCFNILFSAFERMKELGIYEDATIIILGDHGFPATDNIPLPKEIRIGMFYKPSGIAGTPLVKSSAPVSNQNIPATIIKSTGADYSLYGRPLDEIAENEEITRVYYKAICPVPTTTDEYEVYKYHINGNASNFSNWTVVERFAVAKNGNFY